MDIVSPDGKFRHADPRIVITALGAAQILAWGSSFYFPAVFAGPIVADTGWSLGTVVSGTSIGLLAAGLVSPQVGRLIDRHGGRPVLAASSLLYAIGLAGIGLSPSLPFYLAAWVLVRVRHGHRTLRRGLRGARPDVWPRRARADHQPHAVRRLRQHPVLAPERLADRR